MNDFLAIIAFFAPLFLIGATFKFAGSLFNSLNGMSGKLSGMARKGATDNKIAKNFKDSHEKEKTERARQNAARAKNNLENTQYGNGMSGRMRKLNERRRLLQAQGSMGTLGSYGDTRQLLVDASLDESLQNNSKMLNSEMRDLSPGQQQNFLEELAKTKAGDTFEVDGKTYKATGGIKAAAIPKMMDFKINIDSTVTEALDNDDGYVKAAMQRSLADNGAKLDQVATDISRDSDSRPASNGTELAARDESVVTKLSINYGATSGATRRKTREAVAVLASQGDGKLTHEFTDSNGVKQVRTETPDQMKARSLKTAVGLLNQFARDSQLTPADHREISEALKAQGQDIDLAEVANSGGNSRFDIENGKIVPKSNK